VVVVVVVDFVAWPCAAPVFGVCVWVPPCELPWVVVFTLPWVVVFTEETCCGLREGPCDTDDPCETVVVGFGAVACP
jgi:hypothetical protein